MTSKQADILRRIDRLTTKLRDEVRRELERAVEIAGGQSELARKIGVTPNAIWKAMAQGRVSAAMALRIETALDGKISREQLAPQIFLWKAPNSEDES